MATSRTRSGRHVTCTPVRTSRRPSKRLRVSCAQVGTAAFVSETRPARSQRAAFSVREGARARPEEDTEERPAQAVLLAAGRPAEGGFTFETLARAARSSSALG